MCLHHDCLTVGKVISAFLSIPVCVHTKSHWAELPTITCQRNHSHFLICWYFGAEPVIWTVGNLICPFHAWCAVIVVWYWHEVFMWTRGQDVVCVGQPCHLLLCFFLLFYPSLTLFMTLNNLLSYFVSRISPFNLTTSFVETHLH